MALPQTDNFNRPSIGANWSNVQGVLTINSSLYACASSAAVTYGFWNLDTPGNDQVVTVVLKSPTSGAFGGGSVRVTIPSSGSCYAVYMSSTNYYVFKYVNGVLTILANNVARAFADADSIELKVVGTTITVRQNGIQFYTTTDGSLASGSFGLASFGTGLIDTWTGDNAGGGPTVWNGAVILTGLGSLSGVPLRTTFGVGALSGTGSLQAVPLRIVRGQVAMSGLADLVAVGKRVATGRVTMSAISDLAAVALRIAKGAAVLTGQGFLQATAVGTQLVRNTVLAIRIGLGF